MQSGHEIHTDAVLSACVQSRDVHAASQSEIDGIVRFPSQLPAQPSDRNDFFMQLAGELDAIRDLIQRYERAKYPDPPYQYFNGYQVINGVTYQLIQVKYSGEPLNDSALAQIRKYSAIVRKLNIIAGILFAIQFTPGFYEQNINRADKLMEMLQYKIAEISEDAVSDKYQVKSPRNELDDFVSKLIKNISETTGERSEIVTRKLRNAERYFVADNNRMRVFAFRTTLDDGSMYWQVDMPGANRLTAAQKDEYLKIHQKDPVDRPLWFTTLPDWEKDWLWQVVPDPDGNKNRLIDWRYFESIFQSSAMQHIPGIKNTRTNYLVREQADQFRVVSSSIKTSTMVPYEMPDQGRDVNVLLTAEQMLDEMLRHEQDNFNQLRQLFPDLPKDFKPILLAQSLLSDVLVAQADVQLAESQRDAIDQVARNVKFQGVMVISGNDPVNILRLASRQGPSRWDYVLPVMGKAHQFIRFYKRKKSGLNPEQSARYQLIQDALTKLQNLSKVGFGKRTISNISGVNYEAFKVAYTGILVEAMGGTVSTNCKSGKDRTGLEEIYRNAMLIYFEKYQKLPGFDDGGADRKKFIAIFVRLFNSLKAQEAAANNTPGSLGLKDDAKMLCKDIVKELGITYEESNNRAAINKPSTFMDDEAAQGKTRKNKIAIPEEEFEIYTMNLRQAESAVYSLVGNLISSEKDREPVVRAISAFIQFGLSLNNADADIVEGYMRSCVLRIVNGLSECKDLGEIIGYLTKSREEMRESVSQVASLMSEPVKLEPSKGKKAAKKTKGKTVPDVLNESLDGLVAEFAKVNVQLPAQPILSPKVKPSPLLSQSFIGRGAERISPSADTEDEKHRSVIESLDLSVSKVAASTDRLKKIASDGLHLIPGEGASPADQSFQSLKTIMPEVTDSQSRVLTHGEILQTMIIVLDGMIESMREMEAAYNQTTRLIESLNTSPTVYMKKPSLFTERSDERRRDAGVDTGINKKHS